MCHSADTNPRWAQPQKFNGQLKPSSLRRRCRQRCGALASAQQHASFSSGTNVFHHPFRYHHGWNAPILQFFSRPETSHTPHRACAIANQNVSVPWFITQPLNEIIKLVMSQHFTYYDFWISKGSILSQEATAWIHRRERADGTHLRGIFKLENTHHWTNAALQTTRATLTVLFYA